MNLLRHVLSRAAVVLCLMFIISCAGSPPEEAEDSIQSDSMEESRIAEIGEETTDDAMASRSGDFSGEPAKEAVDTAEKAEKIAEVPESTHSGENDFHETHDESSAADSELSGSGIDDSSEKSEEEPSEVPIVESEDIQIDENSFDREKSAEESAVAEDLEEENAEAAHSYSDEGLKTPESREISNNPLLTEDRPYDYFQEDTSNDVVSTEIQAEAGGISADSEKTEELEEVRNTSSERQSVVDSENLGETSPDEREMDRSFAASPSGSEPETRYPASSAEAPDRSMVEPGEITVILQGQGWVFRSDLSTPGPWSFLDRERDGDSTRFLFEFSDTGRWNLVFERQDLSSGGSERTVRVVGVGEQDVFPDEIGREGAVAERDELNGIKAAEDAVASGRIGDALELLEREASAKNETGRRARAALMKLAAGSGSTAQLLSWMPEYIEDGADEDVLALTLNVLEKSAGYRSQCRLALESLAGMEESDRAPEWLYRLANSLEKPGEGRNMDRAAELYQKVIQDWPLSEWKDLAEERLAWLKRHYFRVR